jgi:hypothetical protein
VVQIHSPRPFFPDKVVMAAPLFSLIDIGSAERCGGRDWRNAGMFVPVASTGHAKCAGCFKSEHLVLRHSNLLLSP